MLLNNLDPEVAERPEELVVYGGSGKAARDHDSLRALVRTLLTLGDDETLLVQSGKPVGVLRTWPSAPRVLIANSLLVPRWATWDEFRRLEAEGLTMFGQMTAGSWIYIGTQGILQGTYQTFAAAGERHYGSAEPGRPHDPHRRARRDGRRSAARGHDGRRGDPLHRGRPGADPTAPRDALPRRGDRVAGRRARARSRGRGRGSGALGRPARQRRRGRAGARPPGRGVRPRHRPDCRARSRSPATSRPGSSVEDAAALRSADPDALPPAGSRVDRAAMSRGSSSSSDAAAMFSTMATICEGRPMRQA